MTVGVVGWYHRGNFGDDLMAMMFAKELRSHGTDVLLWGIRDVEATRWGAKSTSQIEEFLESIDVLVFGGGGLLANASVEDQFDRFLSGLIRKATSQNIPIHGVSLGGDGTLDPETVSPGREALIRAADTLTVRNKRDVADVKAFGESATFAHDMVWTCEKYTETASSRGAGQEERILINVEEKSKARKLYVLAACGIQMVSGQRKFDFINIIRTQNPHHGLQRKLSDTGIINYHQITGVDDCLHRIEQSSLVISSKMHIGVVALALGIPFISVFGEPKTKMMLSGIGAGHSYKSSISDTAKTLIDVARGNSPMAVKKSNLEDIKDSSKEHFRLLVNALQ